MARQAAHPAQFTIDFGLDEPELSGMDVQPKADVQPSREPSPSADPDRWIDFISFGSGSSGNSCYVGTRAGGVIVDVGVRDDVIAEALAANGLSMSNVKGVLLTHDHADHVRFVYSLLRKNKHLHLFCTNRVMQGLLRRHNISKRIKEYHMPIFKEIPFRVGPLDITAFDVPHDGTDNMGFSISYDGRNFVLATDMGEIQPRAQHYLSQAHYMVIEANYDSDMLRLGSYPEYLKARIRTSIGHMQNEHTAAFLRQIISERLKYIFLCHLSKDNNRPELALRAVRSALEEAGIVVGDASDSIESRKAQVQLMALPRYEATRRFIFRP